MPRRAAPQIDYTARDFVTIKNELMEYAKRYYSDSFKDFSDSSFGALMLDTVAYVGDNLSYYIDYQANETFLDSAQERRNIIRIGQQRGYKFRDTYTSYGTLSFYIIVPTKTTGLGPDMEYAPTLRVGSLFGTNSGGYFQLTQEIDFSESSNEIVAARMNDSTGIPTHYAIKAFGAVMSGYPNQFSVNMGAYMRFPKVYLDVRDQIAEILSVTDSFGNIYYEVPYLSQNTVYRVRYNGSKEATDTAAALMMPQRVPRRFTFNFDPHKSQHYLQFGAANPDQETINAANVSDPSNVVMDLHNRDYTNDTDFDPARLLSTEKMGIAPANTTLRIIYRAHRSTTANAAAGAVTKVKNAKLRFKVPGSLTMSKKQAVIKSLECYNEESIIGSVNAASNDEMKMRIKDNYTTQNRAVTQSDYVSSVYNMPAKFGQIHRCMIFRDDDSFKRNLNLYVINKGANGKLRTTPSQLKQNLKIHLASVKMINDTIDIMDAKIINLGINFTVQGLPNIPTAQVYQQCVNILKNSFAAADYYIGESVGIAELYKRLNAATLVQDVKDISIVRAKGPRYSDIKFNPKKHMSADGRWLLCPKNCIFEFKFPNRDFTGTVE